MLDPKIKRQPWKKTIVRLSLFQIWFTSNTVLLCNSTKPPFWQKNSEKNVWSVQRNCLCNSFGLVQRTLGDEQHCWLQTSGRGQSSGSHLLTDDPQDLIQMSQYLFRLTGAQTHVSRFRPSGLLHLPKPDNLSVERTAANEHFHCISICRLFSWLILANIRKLLVQPTD